MKIVSNLPGQPRRKKKSLLGAGWVTYLIGAAIVGLMFPFGWLLRAVGGQSDWLPVNLHSVLAADYSADPLALHLPPIQLGLIEDLLNDSATLTPGRFATLEGNLNTPVPTVTPRPGYSTPTMPIPTIPPATPSPRPGQAATSTPALVSFTPPPSQVPSVIPTFPTIYSQTPTQPAGKATPTPPPTQFVTPTPPPTGTPLPPPTETKQPPTSTLPAPTATPIPLPTRTPHPYPEPTDPPYP
jgi:hypothetical protein